MVGPGPWTLGEKEEPIGRQLAKGFGRQWRCVQIAHRRPAPVAPEPPLQPSLWRMAGGVVGASEPLALTGSQKADFSRSTWQRGACPVRQAHESWPSRLTENIS